MNGGDAARPVVLATGNAGKLRELAAVLAPLGVALVAQSELDVAACPEPAVTFVENALVKARHAARQTGLAAIADDSGLAVAALDGLPGVRSARYAGEAASDADNVALLLRSLAGVEGAARAAAFHCVVVYLAHADDPTPLVCAGRWPGRIATAPRGSGGFGYDPVFEPDDARPLTAAELGAAAKNRLSHRARAVAALRELWPQPGR